MEKITLDEFANIKYISNPEYSPSGKNFCFVVTEADKEKNGYKSYIYARKGEDIIKLTSFGEEGHYQFLDDDTLFFGGDREKKEGDHSSKFYVIGLNGGEAEKVLELPIPVMDIKPLKNGDYVFVGATDPKYPDLYLGDKEYAASYEKMMKGNADYEIIEENPFWFNGRTFLRGMRGNIYYYHSDSKKIERLTPVMLSVNGITVSSCEKYVFFNGNDDQGLISFMNSKPYVMNLETKEIKMLLDDDSLKVHGVELAETGLYMFGNHCEHGMNTDGDLYFMDYKTMELKKVLDFGRAVGSSVGSDVRYGGGNSIKADGDDLYFVTTDYDSAYLCKFDGKELTYVMKREGSIDAFDVKNGHVMAVALYDMKAQEIYDENYNQITHFNDYLQNKFISKPEILNFKSDEDEIHGFVLKPIGYEKGKKYPCVLNIHGGPKTVYGPVFYHEMQYWCNLGYFVIYCNPTGSDGRGSAFADIRGKYGTQDYKDIMNFCDEALKAYPDIDETNLFETGGSYGGFMTNWIIGHTNRFKACASQRSISNWLSFYGISDIGVGFAVDQCDADPWGNVEKMWWHSPMKYADKVTTPTLFIHSECDYRCPMAEGMQMYTSLVAHGIETRLVYFRGENHELSRSGKPLHRIKRLDEITNWFEKHKN